MNGTDNFGFIVAADGTGEEIIGDDELRIGKKNIYQPHLIEEVLIRGGRREGKAIVGKRLVNGVLTGLNIG